ncbi:GNAT family protein [Saccharibacillus sacchari]|uniref:GNAT family protein n=1 Tax=Saccharibacillus sacchari TaxID=456493 RepID=A0ACC6PHF5_9BACL
MKSTDPNLLADNAATTTNAEDIHSPDSGLSANELFDFSVFPRLDTPRLILREAKAEDRDGLFALYADEEVMRYLPLDPFESVEEADDEMGWHARIFREQTGIRWMIEERDTGAFVGTCGFLGLEREHNRMEIGYDLAREHWGKGLMPEAIRAVLHFGFGPLAANKIEARVDPDNAASIRLMDKLGFVREGLLRQHEFEKGRYVDLAAYAILRSEYGR